jgi:hypothetical protein
MLTARHFTFPLAVAARVTPYGIVKSTTSTHRAITQHHDVSVVGVHAIQKCCFGQIKSVPDHDLCRPNQARYLSLSAELPAVRWISTCTFRSSAPPIAEGRPGMFGREPSVRYRPAEFGIRSQCAVWYCVPASKRVTPLPDCQTSEKRDGSRCLIAPPCVRAIISYSFSQTQRKRLDLNRGKRRRCAGRRPLQVIPPGLSHVLERITDSSRTSRRVGKVRNSEVAVLIRSTRRRDRAARPGR